MISFVIPLYNEEPSLEALHAELTAVCASGVGGEPAEFVFVDDGSRDRSWAVVRTLADRDPRVHGIRFRRNFGKAAALAAGFGAARGEVVFTLDADLQDDPKEVPRFLARLAEGFDLVSGWKRRRHDPWHKVYPSRVFNGIVSAVTGCRLHDHNCGYKAYRRAVLDEVTLYGEQHRFVPALAHARGFLVGELEVHHRARRFGRSKYGVSRFIKGLLDLVTVRFLTRFGTRPLHALGGLGLALMASGVLAVAALGTAAFLGWPVPGVWPLGIGAAAALIAGLQVFVLGVLAELVTSYAIRVETTYSVAERVGTGTGTPSRAPTGLDVRDAEHPPR